ncbi:hypothetical protein AAG906_016950 [Vitis piasezkii]
MGKLLIATSIDGNGHVFPLAFAIVEEESHDSWSWFLIALRRHVTQREGICLISIAIRNKCLVRNPSVGWSPLIATSICLRHVVSNFNDKFKNKVLKDVAWFSKLDTQKWTQTYDLGYRYGWMTTNIVECINGVLKGARMLPITALVQLTFYRCVSYFETRRAEIRARMTVGDVYIAYAIEKFRRVEAKASGHTVTIFHRIHETFEVITLHGFHMDKGCNKQVVKRVCYSLLGLTPGDTDIDGQRLHLTWLSQSFPTLAPDADEESIQRYTRAYILQLIGGFLFSGKSSDKVHLMFYPPKGF